MTSGMHPLTEPYRQGMLDVGDGQRVYWECCGSPDGQPAVVLHGGPGSGAAPWWRGFFDPGRYRVVLLDQRGAGRSTPSVSDPATDLRTNTTAHLVRDLEDLRRHLGIERWLVLGGSWGATLGLRYAVQHPERVRALVLFAVTTTRRVDVEWLTRGVARFFPEAFARFSAGVPEAERQGDLSAAYARLLASPDPAVRGRAAAQWCAWEQAIVATAAQLPPRESKTHLARLGKGESLCGRGVVGQSAGPPRFADPVFRYGFARTVTHYFSHAAFQPDDAIIGHLDRLVDVPGVLVHGRLDLASPPDTAWHLASRWPGARLVVVEGVGHAGAEAMNRAVVAAADAFAGG